MRRHVHIRHPRQLLHISAQFLRAECAIEADAERPGVHDADPERFSDLSAEGATAGVRDGAADHDRHALVRRGEHLLDREQRGFRVQRVEDRFDQQNVGTTIQQAARGLGIRSYQLGVRHVARRWIVDLWRQRCGAIGGPEHAGHVARTRRLTRLEQIGDIPRQSRAFDVQLVSQRLHAVIGHRDRGRVERIGLENVGAGKQIRGVNGTDQFRPRECEQVVVTAQIARPVSEPRATIRGLIEALALNHGAHRTVEEQDALRQQLPKQCETLRARPNRRRRARLSKRERGERLSRPIGVVLLIVIEILLLWAEFHTETCAGRRVARMPSMWQIAYARSARLSV